MRMKGETMKYLKVQMSCQKKHDSRIKSGRRGGPVDC